MDYVILQEKITEKFMEIAKGCSPGNNWILGATNRVPQVLAEIATEVVKEYENESR